MKGMLITLEGTEGAGKSTQATLLASRIRALGRVVREVREPGGTALGESIRRILKEGVRGGGAPMAAEAELLLMCAARAQLVREVIRPALAAGEVVICDRYLDSSIAYQGWGRGLPMEQVRQAVEIAVGTTVPDLTVMLWVDGALSRDRRGRREGETGQGPDRFEREDEAFFQRVAEGFREVARHAAGRVRWVDGSGDREGVHAEIWRWVAPLVMDLQAEAPK